MTKRPKLTDALKARTGKGAAVAQPAGAATAPRAGRPMGAKGIVVQMNREGWRALNDLALDLDTSVQKLGIEAWNDFLEKNGRGRPIVNPYGQGTPYVRAPGKSR
jgi:hypothetical protein